MPEFRLTPELQEAIEFLMGRIDYERLADVPYGERQFKLERMRRLAERLDNPHQQLSVIHVAGSKGKGSTATMIASMLSAAGYRTGLFTSPHLQRLQERISIDGREIDSTELVALVQTIMPIIREMDLAARQSNTPWDSPTFFETVTALAFLHFQRQSLDAVVLEVGMGGRLDSTNICHPVCSVITSISYEHTQQLGHTLARIAREKAGIIKPEVPTVSGVRPPEADTIIRQRAAEMDSPLWVLGADFDFDYRIKKDDTMSLGGCSEIDFHMPARSGNDTSRLWRGMRMAMLGRHQAANAAIALATMAILQEQGWQIDEQALRHGLETARCPARIEVASRHPTVILDAAHNEASIRALLQTLDEHFPSSRAERVVIFGTTRGKDVSSTLRLLLQWCGQILFTRYRDNPRGVDPDQLSKLAAQIAADSPADACAQPHLVCPDPESAWRAAQPRIGPQSLVCITGSFFLAAEMERFVRPGAASTLTDRNDA